MSVQNTNPQTIMDTFNANMKALAQIVAKNNDDIQFLKSMTNPTSFNKVNTKKGRYQGFTMRVHDIDGDGDLDNVVYNKDNNPEFINGYTVSVNDKEVKQRKQLKRHYYEQCANNNMDKVITTDKNGNKRTRFISYNQWVKGMNDPIYNERTKTFEVPRDTTRTGKQLIQIAFLKPAMENVKLDDQNIAQTLKQDAKKRLQVATDAVAYYIINRVNKDLLQDPEEFKGEIIYRIEQKYDDGVSEMEYCIRDAYDSPLSAEERKKAAIIDVEKEKEKKRKQQEKREAAKSSKKAKYNFKDFYHTNRSGGYFVIPSGIKLKGDEIIEYTIYDAVFDYCVNSAFDGLKELIAKGDHDTKVKLERIKNKSIEEFKRHYNIDKWNKQKMNTFEENLMSYPGGQMDTMLEIVSEAIYDVFDGRVSMRRDYEKPSWQPDNTPRWE